MQKNHIIGQRLIINHIVQSLVSHHLLYKYNLDAILKNSIHWTINKYSKKR